MERGTIVKNYSEGRKRFEDRLSRYENIDRIRIIVGVKKGFGYTVHQIDYKD